MFFQNFSKLINIFFTSFFNMFTVIQHVSNIFNLTCPQFQHFTCLQFHGPERKTQATRTQRFDSAPRMDREGVHNHKLHGGKMYRKSRNNVHKMLEQITAPVQITRSYCFLGGVIPCYNWRSPTPATIIYLFLDNKDLPHLESRSTQASKRSGKSAVCCEKRLVTGCEKSLGVQGNTHTLNSVQFARVHWRELEDVVFIIQ